LLGYLLSPLLDDLLRRLLGGERGLQANLLTGLLRCLLGDLLRQLCCLLRSVLNRLDCLWRTKQLAAQTTQIGAKLWIAKASTQAKT
jgi:hypothetical protein